MKPTFVLLLTLPCIFAIYKEESLSADDSFNAQYRLPRIITPLKYYIKLKPYLDTGNSREFSFDGFFALEFRSDHISNNHLTVHSRDLVYNTSTYSITPGNIKIIKTKYDPSTETITWLFNRTLARNITYVFSTEYKGEIRNDTTGFYRSSYEENGTLIWLATTQFQIDDAHKAFPCLDEPNFKARYTIAIHCPADYTCISNMETKKIEGDLVTFHETPPISSYLIAFVVSKFVKAKASEESDANQIAVWMRPDLAPTGEYAFQAGHLLLESMNDYTGINYHDMDKNEDRSMKMDLAAIPDFWAGAMENWGLLTFREELLVYDPNEISIKFKIDVTTTVSHEIAHMWFGNLVTCHWWKDIWLNEGFATFFHMFNTHKVFPGMGIADIFMVDYLHNSLSTDSSCSALSLSNPNFYSSSKKAAAVLRMIQHWIGDSTFHKALKKYLKNNEFNIAKPSDLYCALQKSANEDQTIQKYNTSIGEVMNRWIYIAGYPLLSVSLNESTGNILLIQERFVQENDSCDGVYKIPITYTHQEESNFVDTKPKFIMKHRTHVIEGHKNTGWVLFNIQQTGFYRVNYDDNLWNALIETLNSNHEVIHKYNRAQIVNDAFNLAKEGYIEYDKMLDIIQFLEHETDYTPWSTAYIDLATLRSRFIHVQPLSKIFDYHILQLMKKSIETLSLDESSDEADSIKLFRMSALNMACNLKHEDCLKRSIDLYRSFRINGTSINPNYREFVYCNGLRYGGSQEFEVLWQKYLSEKIPSEKLVLMKTLGCTSDQEKLHEFLMFTISPSSDIRAQDRMNAFISALMGNLENVETIFSFIKNNVNAIRDVYMIGNFQVMMDKVASRMSTNQLEELEIFVNTHEDLTEDDKESGKDSIAVARKTIEWTESKMDKIVDWLEKKYPKIQKPKIVEPFVSQSVTKT